MVSRCRHTAASTVIHAISDGPNALAMPHESLLSDSRVPSAQLSATAQPLNSWAARTISTQGLDLAAADSVRVSFQHAANQKQLLVAVR